MNSPALDMRAWREAGIQAFGYRACASLFQAPPANEPLSSSRAGPRPVGAITPAIAAEAAPGPVQREMPFLGAVAGEPSRLSREDTMTARRRILADPRVTRAGKAVARALFAHQWYGKTGCWPGYARMAKVAGVSERTIARGMANLIDCGYVARHRRGRIGNPKGGRRSNVYSLQLEFCFGRKPINPAKRPDDSNVQVSATVGTTAIEPGGHHNRNTSTPQTPLVDKPEAKAKSTPVRHGGDGGDEPPCPKCGAALAVTRVPDGTFFQCNVRECWHHSFTPSQQFARVGNYKDNLAYKHRNRARSARGQDYARRTRGDPYADRRAG